MVFNYFLLGKKNKCEIIYKHSFIRYPMVVSNITNESSGFLTDILMNVGEIGLWLQTIGVLVILIIANMVFNIITNKKRLERLKKIESKMNSLDKKINKIVKPKKK